MPTGGTIFCNAAFNTHGGEPVVLWSLSERGTEGVGLCVRDSAPLSWGSAQELRRKADRDRGLPAWMLGRRDSDLSCFLRCARRQL